VSKHFTPAGAGLLFDAFAGYQRPGMPLLSDFIGSYPELFVDKRRIARMDGVELRLHRPRPAEVAVRFDRPWEGPLSAYVTVFEDGDRFRMYYRGWAEAEGRDYTCYAESPDGIAWSKPDLGRVSYRGSKANNIVWAGVGVHNFTPFLDTNPQAPAEQRYKALGRGQENKQSLHAFASPDGIHWEPVSGEPVFTDGKFDSQNLAFWDPNLGRYRCYFRTPYAGVRGIGVTESDDFRAWDPPRLIALDPPTPEHFYTNAVTPYFRNPGYYLGFPKRFHPDRKKLEDHEPEGISEGVFLSSRDGVAFDRVFMEAFLRPGPDRKNWGDRSTMPAWGLVQTGEAEMSLYYSQHYRFPTAHMRRGALRLDGIASARAGYAGGELVTKPVRFSGRRLLLNYSTGAGGSVQVEVRNRFGQPLPGLALDSAPEIYGDSIAEEYRWKSGMEVASAAGEPVQLRFVLHDADLYSYRFADA